MTTEQFEMPAPVGASLPKAPLWLLALLTFSGTLAMHIFVPALPAAGADLGADIATMQMTVSLYIIGLAVGQLFYGPLSDRFGRRPVLIAGLVLYATAGLVAALAPNGPALVAARLFQALGGCAGLVIGRAIVRDTAMPQEAARRLALMNLMVTVGPGLAPLIGGILVATLGWRSILYALAAFGIANLLCAWRLLPETGTPARQASAASILHHYQRLLGSSVFLGYAIGGGCATTAMYAFVAAAPFIISGELHRPAHEIGFYLTLLIAGVWLGSMLATQFIGLIAIDKLLVRANWLSVAAAFAFLAAVLSGHLSVALTVGPMFVFTLGAGMASPAALSQAISVDPEIIGSASGLYGFTQMVVGALCTALAGLGNDPALAAALVLSAAGIIGQLSFWIAQRHRAS
jgi:DHA1 family bicyclomycin/chloramphenicol resistance-like MFS transporter